MHIKPTSERTLDQTMSVTFKKGDLLEFREIDAIAHVVNCLCIRPHGLSMQIAEKYPWGDVYQKRQYLSGRNLAKENLKLKYLERSISHSWDRNFSLLRQEYPPILTSGDVRLSHPRGWDKPIPEVIYLWRHSTSTPNNVEKSRLVSVLDIYFAHF